MKEEKKKQDFTKEVDKQQATVANTQNKNSHTKQEETAYWEDFEEITKGDFRKLLGCG